MYEFFFYIGCWRGHKGVEGRWDWRNNQDSAELLRHLVIADDDIEQREREICDQLKQNGIGLYSKRENESLMNIVGGKWLFMQLFATVGWSWLFTRFAVSFPIQARIPLAKSFVSLIDNINEIKKTNKQMIQTQIN